jgi:glycosyltransferase involved in cell wall biosynthesis
VQNHKGAQAARNKGILEATGNYITFLDSDDEFLPGCIEKQLEFITQYPDDILYSDCIFWDEALDKRKICSKNVGTGNVYKAILVRNNCPMFQGLLCKKEYLLEIGLLDEKVVAFQEWETTIRLAKIAPFRHIEKPLFIYYWLRNDSISKDSVRSIKGAEYIIEKHKDEIVSVCGKDELVRKYRYLLDLSLLFNGYEFDKYYDKWITALKESDTEYDEHDAVKILSLDLYKKYTNSQQMSQIFCQWLIKRQHGGRLSDYFEHNNFKNIAIYGMNYVGEALAEELCDSDINVEFGIDRNADNIKSKIQVIRPDEVSEETGINAVIVTPMAYFHEIYDEYQGKWNVPVISLLEVVSFESTI